ncbi:MAG: cupin domain-containing protein [Acidimicrobiia bacterium]
MDADEVAARLDLRPHPEGGSFREMWRDAGEGASRGAGTAIYYLLRAGEVSHWHRVDATEVWHYYAGAPLELRTSDGSSVDAQTLGPGLADGEHPQLIVPPDVWQAARSLGEWTLVGCTVAPAFQFAGFELAPPGWEPA